MRYRSFLASLLFLTAALQAAEPAKPADAPQPAPNSADGVSLTFCDVTELHGQFSFAAEYLLWGVNGDRLPILAAAGPPGSAGILNRPGTTPLFGDRIDDGWRSGFRLTVGAWLDDDHSTGQELSYFFLGSTGNSFSAAGAGAPGTLTLSRPFFNAQTGLEDSQLLALANVASGSIRVNTSSGLQGGEANMVCNLRRPCAPCGECRPCGDPLCRFDALAGLRYLHFGEDVSVAEKVAVIPGVPVLGGSQFSVLDQFDADNDFFGAQVGLRAEADYGQWFGQLSAKVALGDMHERVRVSGVTRIVTPTGLVTTQPGGVLASRTNSFNRSRESFAVLPEVGATAGCQLTDSVRVFAGYSVLYASDVVRPGQQIDRALNPSQWPISTGVPPLSGPARPAFSWRESDFWAQGVNIGLEFRY